MKKRVLTSTMVLLLSLAGVKAQNELYPGHFNLEEVTLADGPLKTAMDKI